MNDMEKHKQRNEERALAEAAAKMDRLKAEKAGITGAHLKQLSEEHAEDAQMLNIVVQASLQKSGLPGPTTLEDFAVGAELLATRLVNARRLREWTNIKNILDAENEKTPNVVLCGAARRAGVELTVESKPVEAPRLITG